MKLPNKKGYFGEFGGKFIPETISLCLEELEKAYNKAKRDKKFKKKLDFYLREYAGRPSALYFASNLSKHLGIKVYFKRGG